MLRHVLDLLHSLFVAVVLGAFSMSLYRLSTRLLACTEASHVAPRT